MQKASLFFITSSPGSLAGILLLKSEKTLNYRFQINGGKNENTERFRL